MVRLVDQFASSVVFAVLVMHLEAMIHRLVAIFDILTALAIS